MRCDGSQPQLLSLTVEALVVITGGNFDVGTVNFSVSKAGSAGMDLVAATYVRNSMNFNLANTALLIARLLWRAALSL